MSTEFKTPSGESLLSKYSYLIFLLIALLIFLLGTEFFFNPLESSWYISPASGIIEDEVSHSDSTLYHSLIFMTQFAGSVLICLAVFLGGITLYGYRTGRRWVWISLWAIPLLFAGHYFFYSHSHYLGKLQLIGTGISIAALAVKYPTTFKKTRKKKKKRSPVLHA